jgi:hypothetical protein
MTARHRGCTVRAPHAAPVTYPTRRRARAVARQVRGARVSSGVPHLLTLPLGVVVALAGRWSR